MIKECDQKSVGMLVWQGGKLLLIERKKPPFGFSPPAGHLDGDFFEQAAIRELKEETSLEAKKLKLAIEGRKENPCRRGSKWHFWRIYEVEAEGILQRSEDETKQANWYDKNDLLAFAQRTEHYLKGKISEQEWENSPGLEPVWHEWLGELGIIEKKKNPKPVFNHEALALQKNKPLVYTAMSKHIFYFRFFVSQFAVNQGVVPLNPFLIFDYFLLDTVDRNEVREGNNTLVARADETWVFGPVSNGVLAEIKIAQALKKPVRYFKIEKPNKIVQIFSKDEIEMEDDVKDFKNEIKLNNKKIVICGSMRFSQGMVDAKEKLERLGFEVVLPRNTELYLEGSEFLKQREASAWEPMEGAKRKIENNLIRGYYEEIATADAILVVNQEKNGIRNYIGGNGFLEMGFAHILGKRIYCLNPLPEELEHIYQELVALQPIILNNDLSKIAF